MMGDAVDAGGIPEHIADISGDGMSEESAPSIVERLNEDCWRMVFDYVPVEDIVRSERVSRSWQHLVHRYLQQVGLCLNWFSEEFIHTNVKMRPKNRIIIIESKDYQRALKLLEKLGPCVVFSYCSNQVVFERITKCCPNLKGLSINMHRFGRVHLSRDQVKLTQGLERLVLMYFTTVECNMQPHSCTIKFDHSEVRNMRTSCDFWPNFRPTRLKSLVVRGNLDFRYFLSPVELYPELTELWLQGDHDNIHCLLGKMPKLERLYLVDVIMKTEDEKDLGAECRSKCIGLSSLKSISIWSSDMKYWWLEAITNGCRELRSLDFRCSHASEHLMALSQVHGQTLTKITLFFDQNINNADAAAIISACPNLRTLDLRCSMNITEDLLPAAARAAQHHKTPVRLLIGDTRAGAKCNRDIVQIQYPWLIVDTEYYRGLFHAMRPQQSIQQNIWVPSRPSIAPTTNIQSILE